MTLISSSAHTTHQRPLSSGKRRLLGLALLFAQSIVSACQPAPPKPLFEEAGAEGGAERPAGSLAGAEAGTTGDGGAERGGLDAVSGAEAGSGGSSEQPPPLAYCDRGLMLGGLGLEEGFVEEPLVEGSPLARRSVRGARGARRLWLPQAQGSSERTRQLKLLLESLESLGEAKLILQLSHGSPALSRSGDLTPLAPLGQGLWLAHLRSSEALNALVSGALSEAALWRVEPLDSIDSRLARLAERAQGPLLARVTLWGSDLREAKLALQSPGLEALRTALKAQAGASARIDPLSGAPALTQPTYASLPYAQAQGRWTSPPALLTWSEWLAVARHPRVTFISPPMPKPSLLNEPSRAITRAEEVQGLARPVTGSGLYHGWSGRGVRAAVMDSGVINHPDFYRYSPSGEWRGDRVLGDLPPDGEGHGTIVAGILAGNGWLSEQRRSPLGRRGAPLQWRGQAPEVSTIYSYLMQGDLGADLRPPWEQAFEAPEEGQAAHLINHSHTYNNGYYAPENQGYDAFVAATAVPRADRESSEFEVIEGAGEGRAAPRPVFFAAGNNGFWEQAEFLILKGYYGLMVNFKNNIIVGSIESNDTQHSDSSSLGPTIDGRIKPDIVAPGSSDPRPLNGFKISVGEVRLHARQGSGAPDKSWRWSQPSGWRGSAGFDVDEPSSGASLRGDVLEGFSYGNSYRTRLTWSATDEDAPLDPSLYDQLSFELKVELPEQPTELADLMDRPPLPLSVEPPQFFAFNWADDRGTRFDGALYFAYGDALDSGEWTRVRVPLGEGWAGQLSELHRLRITPGLYLSGIYAPSIDGGYELSSGTSMASPAAAGVSALALEQLHSLGLYHLESKPPPPATVRALMTHTARDLKREEPPARSIPNPDTKVVSLYGEGPDWNTGYGLVDAWALSRLIDAHAESSRWREAKIRPEVLHHYRVQVSGAGPLKVTLAWDDPPASLLVEQWAPKLVHDLDLAVRGPIEEEGPEPKVYGPWILTPPPLHSERYTRGEDEFSAPFVIPAQRCIEDSLEALWSGQPRAGFSPSPLDVTEDGFVPQLNRGCVDELNNLEEVLVDAPSPGTYELIVRGPKLGGIAQRYTLMFSEGCALVSDTL